MPPFNIFFSLMFIFLKNWLRAQRGSCNTEKTPDPWKTLYRDIPVYLILKNIYFSNC